MRAFKRLSFSLLLGVVALPAWALDVADPSDYFMRLCMKDMTVAVGKRTSICQCVHDGFAYGADTGLTVTDAITLDHRLWEAPDRRMPKNAIGDAVRMLRHQCLTGDNSKRAMPRADEFIGEKLREIIDET